MVYVSKTKIGGLLPPYPTTPTIGRAYIRGGDTIPLTSIRQNMGGAYFEEL